MAEPQELRLTRAFSQCPITALEFFDAGSYLLAGEDTHLAVYDLSAGRFVTRVRVFAGQPIHGIRVLNGRVLLWGAAKIAVIVGDDVEELIRGGDGDTLALKRVTAPDWIYDAALSPFDPDAAALITAHNEVIPVRFDTADGSPTLGAVVSPSRPMLYAANLKWVSDDCVLVAGGTVFGDILMWKYHLKSQQPEMLSVLAGHEGSIFGVQISDELPCLDGSTIRLLASCSDDRTVRIWDITSRRGKTVGGNMQHELVAPRETGFGSTPGLSDAETERPIAVVMGHASRIWGVKFAPSTPGDVRPVETLAVYSFGEDSTMQRWRLDLNASSSGDALGSPRAVSAELKHQETIDVHDGKHLWAHALTSLGNQTVITTGGADSKISLMTEPTFSSSSAEHEPTHQTDALDLQEVIRSFTNPRILNRGRGPEIIGRYDFFSQNEVLATSSLGRLMLGTFDNGLQWREVDLEDSIAAGIQSCYVLKTIGEKAALLGTTSGSLYHYSETHGMSFVGKLHGKVVNIVRLAGSGEVQGISVELLVHLHGTPDAQYFTLDWRTGAVLETADIRGMDPRFVAMSAAKIKGGLIAIGSRHGWLSILRRGEEGFRPVLDFSTSSKDAITGIVPLPGSDADGTASPYFLSTSRDSKYRIYEIENADADVRLHLRNETAPPFGSIIEGGWFTRDVEPELIMYGFKSKKLIVWNETRREEIATIECGGSHRTFTLMHNPIDPHYLRFGFTRTSKLFIYSQRGSVHRPIKTGTHGREIRALSCNSRYIATGSEDTTIRIWEYKSGKQGQGSEREMRCLASMKLHITGMQQVKWLGDDYLLSSAGNEEFFVWRVRRLKNTTYGGLGVVCEAVFDDKSKDGDLRIMDFDASKVGTDGSIIITMVLSNSALKTYRYTPDGSFGLLAHMSYTGACLTQVRHLGVNENGLSALTASTDGHLATWEARFDHEKNPSYVLVHVAPVHQNGIKSLDLKATPEGFWVLTGGDDNGLGVASLTVLSDEAGIKRYTVFSRDIVRKAHAAAINGVALIQRGNATLGISASNDQRVKLWRIDLETMELVADEYSGVADPGGLDVMESTSDNVDNEKMRVIVGGVGIEVWTV
ncbi:WD40-repeat-containing domain protein [Dactylonectria estremocensis]|uniref:WD40-repeat-containing domain protein n=1 Tax=Dactylonectria estremocensis TaxID=1079267 RepID=A0A9P9F776_9HYPO|nr:WD40-repeat-containing domain protein [Dactylonectria estremocensis]